MKNENINSKLVAYFKVSNESNLPVEILFHRNARVLKLYFASHFVLWHFYKFVTSQSPGVFHFPATILWELVTNC